MARGYLQVEVFLRRHLAPDDPSEDEVRALAALALGALVHYRQNQAIYGHPPADADESAFVDAWVELWALRLATD